MKRILVFALLIAMCISVCAAEGSVSGSEIGKLGKPQQTVELNLAELDSFAFGFSTSEAHTANEGPIFMSGGISRQMRLSL